MGRGARVPDLGLLPLELQCSSVTKSSPSTWPRGRRFCRVIGLVEVVVSVRRLVSGSGRHSFWFSDLAEMLMLLPCRAMRLLTWLF